MYSNATFLTFLSNTIKFVRQMGNVSEDKDMDRFRRQATDEVLHEADIVASTINTSMAGQMKVVCRVNIRKRGLHVLMYHKFSRSLRAFSSTVWRTDEATGDSIYALWTKPVKLWNQRESFRLDSASSKTAVTLHIPSLSFLIGKNAFLDTIPSSLQKIGDGGRPRTTAGHSVIPSGSIQKFGDFPLQQTLPSDEDPRLCVHLERAIPHAP
jgi:hypothetical protein